MAERLRTCIGMVLAMADEDEERWMELLRSVPADHVQVAAYLHQMASFAAALTDRAAIERAALVFAVEV